jgi:hypothetical protein
LTHSLVFNNIEESFGLINVYQLLTYQVWEVNTGLAVTSPLLLHSSWVTDVAIAADGSTLLTAGDRYSYIQIPRAKLSLGLKRIR